jgi:hypothetical protein
MSPRAEMSAAVEEKTVATSAMARIVHEDARR